MGSCPPVAMLLQGCMRGSSDVGNLFRDECSEALMLWEFGDDCVATLMLESFAGTYKRGARTRRRRHAHCSGRKWDVCCDDVLDQTTESGLSSSAADSDEREQQARRGCIEGGNAKNWSQTKQKEDLNCLHLRSVVKIVVEESSRLAAKACVREGR